MEDELDELLSPVFKWHSADCMAVSEGFACTCDNKTERQKLKATLLNREKRVKAETAKSELEFLKRLKLEFDANKSVEAGEAWADSDAADLVNKRIAQLRHQHRLPYMPKDLQQVGGGRGTMRNFVCDCGTKCVLSVSPDGTSTITEDAQLRHQQEEEGE